MNDQDVSISPHEQTLDLNGQPLRYRVAGRGPALMVQGPGWGIGAGLYEGTLAPLEERFTVVYHDPRGSGGSRPASDESVNVGSFASDLDSLRQHLGLGSIAVLGHSHGAFIAMNYALAYPKHVSRLVLVGAQLGVDEPREDAQRNLPLLAQDSRFAPAVAAFGGPFDTENDLKARIVGSWPLFFANPENPAALSSREAVRASSVPIATMKAASASDANFLVRRRLASIRARTLVMVGRHDFLCSPVQAQIIHEGIRNSTLQVFEHSGHFPWLEEPAPFFVTLTRFLAGVR